MEPIGGMSITRSSKCTYLGLIIDEKLNWYAHPESKYVSGRNLLSFMTKCCRLTWGLSRSTLTLLYKSVFLPTFLYNCSVWANVSKKKKVKKALLAVQRPFAITIAYYLRL